MKIISLIFLLFLATFLRIWQLNNNPPALNWDEVSHGYNAYSILQTGRDEWGKTFPLTSFRAYGDYKLPLYIYTTVPFITLLGLNEWSVRLPSAFAGIGTVILVFLLVKKVSCKFSLAFFSAFLLAVSQWHLVVSRAAFEANLALFFLVLGMFLLGLNLPRLLPLSFFFMGLSTYTYNSAKLFVPLLITAILILFSNQLFKNLKILIFSCLIFLTLFLPHLALLKNEEGKARFYWTTILDQGAVNTINEKRSSSTLPYYIAALIHNKPVYFVSKTFNNWLNHFLLSYLVFKGGNHLQYAIPGFGVVYTITLPFLVIGAIASVFSRDRRLMFLLAWLFLSPIPSAITRDSPHVLRSIFEVIPLQILTAFGLFKVGQWFSTLPRLVFYTAFLIIALLNLTIFLYSYFGSYRRMYSWAWQYGYRQVAEFVAKSYNQYSKIIITKKYGEPHEFMLFYLKWPPQNFQNDPSLIRFHQSNWYWVDRFDKFYFVNDWQIPKKQDENFFLESGSRIELDGKILLVTSPDNAPYDWRRIGVIYFLDGTKAFELYEYENARSVN